MTSACPTSSRLIFINACRHAALESVERAMGAKCQDGHIAKSRRQLGGIVKADQDIGADGLHQSTGYPQWLGHINEVHAAQDELDHHVGDADQAHQ